MISLITCALFLQYVGRDLVGNAPREEVRAVRNIVYDMKMKALNRTVNT